MIRRRKYPERFADLFSRRDLLKRAAIGTTAFASISDYAQANSEKSTEQLKFDFPIVDYHVHLAGGFNIERAVEVSKKRGIKFGIVKVVRNIAPYPTQRIFRNILSCPAY